MKGFYRDLQVGHVLVHPRAAGGTQGLEIVNIAKEPKEGFSGGSWRVAETFNLSEGVVNFIEMRDEEPIVYYTHRRRFFLALAFNLFRSLPWR